MIIADVVFGISHFCLAKCGTPMPAGIEEGVQLTILVARNDYRAPANLSAVKVKWILNLRFMAEINPGTLKNILEFDLEEIGVGIDVAVNAENTRLRIVHNVL